MLRRILFLCAVLLCGCSHLTVAPKPVVAHSIAFSGNQQNAGIIDCDKTGCLVNKSWMDHYDKMETKVNDYIQADTTIKREGVNWRVSYETMNHFLSLRSAERGG